MPCLKITKSTCTRGHKLSVACSKANEACTFCTREDLAKEKRRQRDIDLDAERDRKRKEYAQRLQEAQDDIAHLKRVQQDRKEDEQRTNVLRDLSKEAENLKRMTEPPNPKKVKPQPEPKKEKTDAKAGAAKEAESQLAVDTAEPPEDTSPEESSTAKEDWEWEKEYKNARSDEIDKLMDMIGLETIKEKFLAIKSRVDLAVQQDTDIKKDRFGSVLLGNPGTGKTTVARLYASFLASMGVIPGDTFEEVSGSRLANDGVSGCQKRVEGILNAGGGVLFIDEAYQLVSGSSFGGSSVLDFLLAEVENLTGKAVFILAGYQRPMEKFFAHNPGLPSRFPHELMFKDYEDKELHQILQSGIKRRYNGKMKVEGGLRGLFCRIVARRIGTSRGREGFANARAVENEISKIAARQSKRLQRQRKKKGPPTDALLLTREDLIGPEPSQALERCASWKKLKDMIGLASVKQTVEGMLDSIKYNYQRELEEKPLVEFSLNKVFLGSPGTGKTTVAKLYGQLLVDLGMLSNGEGMPFLLLVPDTMIPRLTGLQWS